MAKTRRYATMPLALLIASVATTPLIPTITAPYVGQTVVVGVPFSVAVTLPQGTVSATVQLGIEAPVALTIVGTSGTATLMPVSGDVSVAEPLLVTTAKGGTQSITIDVEDSGAFWLDATNAASYTATGTAITSLKSLISGTPLSTITGNPLINTDPRDGKPGFWFDDAGSGSFVEGADATLLAALNGTDKPFTTFVVTTPGDVTFNACTLSIGKSTDSGNGYEFMAFSGSWYLEKDGAPAGPAKVATSIGLTAGLSIVEQRTSDGVTVSTAVNGGSEVAAAAFASPGAISATTVGVGIMTKSTKTLPYYGYIREILVFSSSKTAPQIAAITAYLKAKWRKPTQFVAVGDSITANAIGSITTGGFSGLLVAAVRAAGGIAEAQGPFGTTTPVPHRHSGVSGDTCVLMNTRVLSNTQGFGKGGSSKGYYSNCVLALLYAGTNPDATTPTAAQTATDYFVLLNNLYTQGIQGNSNFRIAVSPLMAITGQSAYVAAFNPLLVSGWATFEAAHPGVLIYWDANASLGGVAPAEGTHPNDAEYTTIVNHPTHGLAQACVPFLLSQQPA